MFLFCIHLLIRRAPPASLVLPGSLSDWCWLFKIARRQQSVGCLTFRALSSGRFCPPSRFPFRGVCGAVTSFYPNWP